MNLMQASIIWHSQKRKISELKPAPYNPRELTEKQAQDLATSLELFNLAEPIVINQNNTIVGGHQRINILKAKYGDNGTEVDVRVPNRLLTQDEEVELNLRLNKNLGQWNFDALANFDEELLKDVGFESQELDKIFQLDLPNEDDVPEVKKTNIKLGNMFKLGEHRLLCGDATKREDVERLMQGEKADMVFTDPPYNVGLEYNQYKDDKTVQDYLGFVDMFYERIKDNLKEGGSIYIMSGNKFLLELGLKFKNIFRFSQILFWIKENSTLGNSDYQYNYEAILYGWNRGTHKYYGGSVIPAANFVKRDTGLLLTGHKAQRPIKLVEDYIKNSLKREDMCLDLFGGSGSTLIACEKLNRKCRMTEIDPIYCQVIIDRWQNFTGKKAKKLNVGSNSDELVGCGVKYP